MYYKNKTQLLLLYRNTLYKLENEKALLQNMVKDHLNNGRKNFSDNHDLLAQNKKVDELIVREMQYREILGMIEIKEA